MQLRLSLDSDVPRRGAILVTEMKFHAVHEFDVRQFKTSTQDWETAFKRAVWKRVAASNHPVFVGLSSGYDSGALHLALEAEAAAHSVNYFTVAAEEHPDLIDRRLSHNKSVSRAFLLSLSLQDFRKERAWLELFSEPFQYGRSNWAGGSVQEDGAAAGLSAIFRRCRKSGILVYLSGAGADEIISDYGFAGVKFFPHSSFGGLFPDELTSIFPWPSVFLGTQRDYLMKEEVVAGSHGVEARYPFLDKQVVQEFLWLSDTVKNEKYKRPVHEFLSAIGYPFDMGNKDGFAAGRNLKLWGETSVEVLYDSLLMTPPRPSAEPESGSCVLGSGFRSGSWQLARSQLVAFLATPEKDVEAIGNLGSALVAFSAPADSLGEPEPCMIGELCLQLLVLLLLEPSSRAAQFRLERLEHLLPVIFALSWETVIMSGWPMFALLVRLAREMLETFGIQAAPRRTEALEVALATVQAVVQLSDASKASIRQMTPSIQSAQAKAVDFWTQEEDVQAVLQSSCMRDLFSAMETLSQPHYRVNLADAWHLASSEDVG